MINLLEMDLVKKRDLSCKAAALTSQELSRHGVTRHHYLHKGGYVIGCVHLSVCLSLCL